MSEIPEWLPTAKALLNRLIIIYGESGSGKSFIIKHIMKILEPHIPQIKVYAPTNSQNHMYDANGAVPIVFIHPTINPTALNNVWERQECMKVTYDRANDLQTLRSLFLRVCDREAIAMEESLRGKLKDIEENLKKTYPDAIVSSKMEEHKDAVDNMLRRFYKSIIEDNVDRIKAMHDLSPAEAFSVKYRYFMPRLLLIFDDCTDQLCKSNGASILQKLFYQGRWQFITTIIACHTDKTFVPELKKQAFVSIFTAPECFATYIDRPSNGLDKVEKIHAHNVKKAIFVPSQPHQKLVWDRLGKQYYRYTAVPVTVKFCSRAVREYAEKIRRKKEDAIKNNKYADKFS